MVKAEDSLLSGRGLEPHHRTKKTKTSYSFRFYCNIKINAINVLRTIRSQTVHSTLHTNFALYIKASVPGYFYDDTKAISHILFL